jgi:hypothetical protein
MGAPLAIGWMKEQLQQADTRSAADSLVLFTTTMHPSVFNPIGSSRWASFCRDQHEQEGLHAPSLQSAWPFPQHEPDWPP